MVVQVARIAQHRGARVEDAGGGLLVSLSLGLCSLSLVFAARRSRDKEGWATRLRSLATSYHYQWSDLWVL